MKAQTNVGFPCGISRILGTLGIFMILTEERFPVPVLLRKALDELQRAAVRHQVQGTLALVVGVVDIGPILREKASDGRPDADLVISQKARGVQLWMKGEDDGKVNRRKNKCGYLQC